MDEIDEPVSAGRGVEASKCAPHCLIEIAILQGFWHTMASMKNLIVIICATLFALTARAALPQPDLLAQIHFAGVQKISADPHVHAFTNEFCSAEALALRAQTATKLSGWLAGWLQSKLNVNVPDGASKLRPLFDDLQKSEFFLEARTAANGQPEVAVAINLAPARAQLWQENLKKFVANASFKSTGSWLIFDSNPALLGLGNRLEQKISTQSPGWFDLDINWPHLAQWYPTLKELALPETQLTLTAPDDNFRINGKFYFPQNLALNLEPWRVPTNTIRTPFNSFTAVRGFAPWFQSQAWAQPYQISPTPNQLFIWSLPSFPYQMYAATPVSDSMSALSQAYERFSSVLYMANLNDKLMTHVTPDMTNKQVFFKGVPFAALQLRALTEPSGQFLFAELFPNAPRNKEPLPPQLFTRLATPNLVYYHWEITASRIPQLLQVTQLGLMMTMHNQLGPNSAAFKWLQRIGAPLGNTDTEVTQSGPAEFTFARKAPGIFTAMELFTLANWFEAKNFPGFDIKTPPRSQRLRQRTQQFQLTPYPSTK